MLLAGDIGGTKTLLGLFDAASGAPPPEAGSEADDEVLATLRGLDVDDLSPRAALDLLATLTKKLTDPG